MREPSRLGGGPPGALFGTPLVPPLPSRGYGEPEVARVPVKASGAGPGETDYRRDGRDSEGRREGTETGTEDTLESFSINRTPSGKCESGRHRPGSTGSGGPEG